MFVTGTELRKKILEMTRDGGNRAAEKLAWQERVDVRLQFGSIERILKLGQWSCNRDFRKHRSYSLLATVVPGNQQSAFYTFKLKVQGPEKASTGTAGA